MDRNRLALVSRVAGWAVLLAPLAFLLVFFVYPLGAIFELSFTPDGVLDLGVFRDIWGNSYYRETLWFTVWQAALSTALTLIFAIAGAQVFTRYQFFGKRVLLALATLPFVLPTVVVAVAFTALLGERSTLNTVLMDIFTLDEPPIRLERTLTLILIAHVFYNYAVALRIISSYWANLNTRMLDSAAVLGASPFTIFWRITLPMLLPAILAAGMLVYIFTFTSFGVVLLLGGLRYATLEVEIYQQATAFFSLPTAGALSVIQLIATLLMMGIYTRLQSRLGARQTSQNLVQRPPRNLAERLWVGANVLLIVLLLIAPLVALVERSLLLGHSLPDVSYYEALSQNERGSIFFVPPIEAVENSLRIAGLVTLMAVVLGTLAAYLLARPSRLVRWLDPFLMLPLATSAVTLGFGFVIALDEPPLNLRDSFWILPIAHTLVAMPFVVRSVLPALQRIDRRLRESAAVLGANAWQRWWRVELPQIRRGLLVGATFAFTISMGEFGAAVFVARADTPTIPVVIFRFLGQPGLVNFGQALAMSVILMAVCAAGFILIEVLNKRAVGDF